MDKKKKKSAVAWRASDSDTAMILSLAYSHLDQLCDVTAGAFVAHRTEQAPYCSAWEATDDENRNK